MSTSNKTSNSQIFRMMLYNRPLHPELFRIMNRRTISQPDYELEAWLVPSGHALRFQANGQCVSELLLDQELHLPERGLLHCLPCIGEKEHEQEVEKAVQFIAAAQTEVLSENLFLATYQEMSDFAKETHAMVHMWEDENGAKNLSMLDLQPYKGLVHTDSYHLIGTTGFVLRTQSIFKVM